jgi:peptidoglycan biosynthesis protein MviN/MurJ (putative lipid II flippase)
MKLVCLQCKITRDKTAEDITKEGRVYRCHAGHAMSKARSPFGMGILSALLTVPLSMLLRVVGGLIFGVNMKGSAAAAVACFGALLVYAGSKRLDPRVSALGKHSLGAGIGLLAGAGVIWVLYLLGVPGPLE